MAEIQAFSDDLARMYQWFIDVGYSVDLCDHIAAAVKQQLDRPDIAVNYVPVTAKTRFVAIDSGNIMSSIVW